MTWLWLSSKIAAVKVPSPKLVKVTEPVKSPARVIVGSAALIEEAVLEASVALLAAAVALFAALVAEALALSTCVCIVLSVVAEVPLDLKNDEFAITYLLPVASTSRSNPDNSKSLLSFTYIL